MISEVGITTANAKAIRKSKYKAKYKKDTLLHIGRIAGNKKRKKHFPLKTKWHHKKLPKAEKPQVTILTQLVRRSKTHRFTDKLYSTLSASKVTGRNKYTSNSKSHNK